MENTFNEESTNITKSETETRKEFIEIDKADMASQIVKASYWFYFIAALSLLNSLFTVFDKGISFQLGLGMTQIIDVMITNMFGGYNVLSTILNVFIALIFAALGYLGSKHNRLAFAAGIILYGLDAVIFLLSSLWMSVIIHLVVIYMLYKGFRLINEYTKLAEEAQSL